MLRYLLLLSLWLVSFAGWADELELARNHISNMEYAQAIKQIQAYLAMQPQDIDAQHLLARTYAWDNQYAKAEQIYNQLLSKEADNTQYLFGKAQTLIWQHKNAAAVPLLEAVIQHIPEQVEAWRLLILTLQQSSKPQDKERAMKLGQQARARFPELNWDLIVN